MRFVHCSDLHVTQDYAATPWRQLGWRRVLAQLELTVGGRAAAYRDAASSVRGMTDECARHHASHLLISGDVTAYATDREFEAVRAALGDFAGSGGNCSIVPGNHDYFTANAVRTGRFERHFAALLESDMPEHCREGPYPFVHLKDDEAAVVGLRSAQLLPMPGLSYGMIGEAQLAGFDAVLADPRMRHRAVLIVVHHPPLGATGGTLPRVRGLRDAAALMARARGPRFAVLHGHLHRRFHHEATATTPHLVCAGSSTQRGREGYWLIEVTDGAIVGVTMHAPRASARN